MVDKFILSPNKDSDAIREIVLLGPVLPEEHYRRLLDCFLRNFDVAEILIVELLQGIVQLVQDASSGYLRPDDMIQILRIIRRRLEDNGQQAEDFSFELTLAVSKLLDIMADHRVEGLNRCEEYEPLIKILLDLKVSEDPFLHYQALYAFQALQ